MKFKDLVAEWLSAKEQKLQKSSLDTYRAWLATIVLPALGEKEEITEQDIRTFLDTLKASGVKQSSYRNYVNMVRRILRFGAERGWCQYPSWVMGLQSKEFKSEKPPMLLNAQQETALIGFLMSNTSPRNLGMFLSLTFGLRLGEVCDLRWGDIDLSKHTIRVIEGPGQLRRLPIPPQMRPFLKICGIGKESATYVCTGTTKPLPSPKSIRDSLKVVAKNLDLPVLTFNDLRHNFTVRCIRSGCSFATLMSLLGYSNAQLLYEEYKPFFPVNGSEAMNAQFACVMPEMA